MRIGLVWIVALFKEPVPSIGASKTGFDRIQNRKGSFFAVAFHRSCCCQGEKMEGLVVKPRTIADLLTGRRNEPTHNRRQIRRSGQLH